MLRARPEENKVAVARANVFYFSNAQEHDRAALHRTAHFILNGSLGLKQESLSKLDWRFVRQSLLNRRQQLGSQEVVAFPIQMVIVAQEDFA